MQNVQLTDTQLKTMRLALEAWRIQTERLMDTHGDNWYHNERLEQIKDARRVLIFQKQPEAPYLGD